MTTNSPCSKSSPLKLINVTAYLIIHRVCLLPSFALVMSTLFLNEFPNEKLPCPQFYRRRLTFTNSSTKMVNQHSWIGPRRKYTGGLSFLVIALSSQPRTVQYSHPIRGYNISLCPSVLSIDFVLLSKIYCIAPNIHSDNTTHLFSSLWLAHPFCFYSRLSFSNR